MVRRGFDLATKRRPQFEHLLAATRLCRDDTTLLDLEIITAGQRIAQRYAACDDVLNAHPRAGLGIDHARVTDHALGKSVLAEAADLFEHALGEFARDALLFHA